MADTQALAVRIANALEAMPSCASCRHWGDEEYPGSMYPDAPRRVCGVLSRDNKDESGTLPVRANMSRGEIHWVETSPDFGCKAWEPHG